MQYYIWKYLKNYNWIKKIMKMNSKKSVAVQLIDKEKKLLNLESYITEENKTYLVKGQNFILNKILNKSN
jgi:hypothetical protein